MWRVVVIREHLCVESGGNQGTPVCGEWGIREHLCVESGGIREHLCVESGGESGNTCVWRVVGNQGTPVCGEWWWWGLSLPVVEYNVGPPDEVGRNADLLETVILGRVPHQLLVLPLLKI